MIDRDELRASCRNLAARLDGTPQWPVLKAVYLDLATLVGRLQGVVNDAIRSYGASEETRAAEASLARVKSSVRQVGLDIRLSSEAALSMGLQTALESACETLDWLDRIEA